MNGRMPNGHRMTVSHAVLYSIEKANHRMIVVMINRVNLNVSKRKFPTQ